MDLINDFVLWRPIKVVSVILYALILICWPISAFWATILLFALICFWSRVPAMISPLTKELEVCDFFTLIIALNYDGLFAGIFGGSIMLFSRIFGPREWFPFTLKNSAGIFLGGLLSPYAFAITGSPLVSMYIFTAIRYITVLVLTAIFEPQEMGLEIFYAFTNSFGAYLSNTFLMVYFEAPLARVMANGVNFDLGLFGFASLVVGFFYLAAKFAKWWELKKMKTRPKPVNPANKFTDEQLRYMPGEGIGVYRYYY